MNINIWKKRDPFAALGPTNGGLSRLRDEMERTFDRFLAEPFGAMEPKALRSEGWMPPLDVSETENEVMIRAEVPGVPVKDLEISLTGNALVISGKKEEHEEKKGEDFYQCERRFGSFRRMVELPETVDPEKVTAEADNGLVTVHVAKKPGAKPRQIEVKPVSKKVPVAG